MNIIEELKKLSVGNVIESANLKKYTTYHAGGIATAIVTPDDEYSLIKLIRFLKDNNIKYKILGRGSNLIFKNETYDGVLIKLDKFDNIDIDGVEITAGAGVPLIKLEWDILD